MRSLTLIWTLLATTLPAYPHAPLFKEVPPSSSGLHFTHPLEEDHPSGYLYHSGMAVGGICIGDVNNDGINDIYTVGGPNKNRLHIGSSGLSYSPSPQNIFDDGTTWGTGASLVDIDNDGDLDIYQCNYDSHNQLFINNGNGHFDELPGAAGLGVKDSCMGAFFADIDNDGDLDCFILCYRLYNPKGRPAKLPYQMVNGQPVVQEDYRMFYDVTVKANGEYLLDAYGRRDYLFLNNGLDANGHPVFQDISHKAGVGKKGHGLSAVWWDYDLDGDLDLYVANDFTDSDRLFQNNGPGQSGIPTFTDVIANTLPSTTWSSMGSDSADVNNDGWPDLLALDMSSSTHFKAKTSMGELTEDHRLILTHAWPRQNMRNHLFINHGKTVFGEQAFAAGLASSDWSWTAKFGDLDNDGWLDLFITNGMARNIADADILANEGAGSGQMAGKTEWEFYKDQPRMPENNLSYQNIKGNKFKSRKDWGLDLNGMSYSAAMADLDNDGDLDLIVSDLGKHLKLYQNQGNNNNSLRVKLHGTKSNRMGIGAKVVVTDSSGEKRTRWMNPWTGFQSQHDNTLHFGLGEATATLLEIHWPSNTYQKLNLKQQTTEITVTENSTGKPTPQPAIKPRFTATNSPDFTHKEKIFDDFKGQPLLPSKHSQLGPCLAAGDVDGDGDDDFYVGGGNGQAGALFINQQGNYHKSYQSALGGLAKYADDTAALWFDADGDKDLDLVIVTGGSEFNNNDIVYHDHLYINQSTKKSVKLTRAPDGAFPNLKDSGSCVTAADYDADGDLDLFIGSRLIPGKYPTPPENRLLRNDTENGTVRFTEVTPNHIKHAGMVTDATWADIDQDGDPDLVVATDWGPVKIFNNHLGQLTDISKSSGTSGRSGWWRSIHATDIDGDGDIDLIAGNVGINTKYKKPSKSKPAKIYYGDMDGSGIPHIVEAKKGKDVHNRDRPLPVRGRF